MPAVTVLPAAVELDHQAGSAPGGTVQLLTALDQTWRGSGHGSVVGALDERCEQVAGSDFSYAFTLAPEESGIAFDLELSAEDWGLVTDLAVLITDQDGHALVRSGFSYRRTSISFSTADGATPGVEYSLDLVAATGDPDLATPEWTVSIRELRTYAAPVDATLRRGDAEDDDLVLYPDHPAELALELASTPPARPDGFAWLARVTLRPDDTRLPELPLELELE
jgi:hypothetical protein